MLIPQELQLSHMDLFNELFGQIIFIEIGT